MSNRVPKIYKRKLSPLSTSDDLIDRSGLIKRLESNGNKKACIISAPMGSGKTILLSQYYREQKPIRPIAWLSLDNDDINPARFFVHLTQAIQKALPTFCAYVMCQYEGTTSPQANLLLGLFLDALNQLPVSPIIIIDNLQFLDDAQWRPALTSIIEQSQNTHWILSGQNKSTLKIHHWKDRDDMTFIDQQVLYFNERELKEYLRLYSPNHSIEEFCDTIYRNTLGWPAGVKLAQLYLNKVSSNFSNDKIANGNQLFLTILNNIIDSFDTDTIYFLINTAFLDRFNGELCEFVLSRPNCSKILSNLEQTAFFVEKNQHDKLPYQYHPLVRKLLLDRFSKQSNDFNNRLISKASLWLTENGFRNLACKVSEKHSVKSFFIEYLRQCFIYWLRKGDVMPIFNWIREHKDSNLLEVDEIKVAWCWALTLSGQISTAETALEQHFSIKLNNNDALDTLFINPENALQANTAALIATLKLFKNELNDHTITNLKLLYRHTNVSNDLRASINNVLAQHYTDNGNFADALDYSEAAFRISEQQGNVFSLSIAVYIKARLLYLNNDIPKALEICEDYLQNKPSSKEFMIKALLGGMKAFLLYNSDQPKQAYKLSHQLAAFCEPGFSIDLQYYIFIPIVRYNMTKGGNADVKEVLDFLELSAVNSGSQQFLAEVIFERFRLAASINNQPELDLFVHHYELEAHLHQCLKTESSISWATRERWLKCAIIYYSHKKEYEKAKIITQKLLSMNVEQGHPIQHLPITMIFVWLEYCKGQRNMAYTHLNEVLTQAEATGLMMGLFDDIPGVSHLLNNALIENKINDSNHAQQLIKLGFGKGPVKKQSQPAKI